MLASFGLLFATILILVGLVGTFGLPFTGYDGTFGHDASQAIRTLGIVADLKKERFVLWLEERKENLSELTRSNLIKADVERIREAMCGGMALGKDTHELRSQILSDDAYQAVIGQINFFMDFHRSYRKVRIVEPGTGLILVSTAGAEVGGRIGDEGPGGKVLTADYRAWVGVQRDPFDGKPYFAVARAISGSTLRGEGEPAAKAAVILYIDPDDFLRPMLYTGDYLGERGEVVLVDHKGTVLMTLRHSLPDGTSPRVLEYRFTAKPAVLAARGKEGIIFADDYRGVRVLAAYRHIRLTPDQGWGMIVKMDVPEIMGPARLEVLYLGLVGLVGLVLGGIATIPVANRMAAPITSLSLTAQDVKAGNLAVRSPVSGSDEVAILAGTFNAMLDRIQNWNEELEEQVRQRTTELELEISRRIEAEDTLRQSKHTLEVLINAGTDFVALLDVDGNFVALNEAMAARLGVTAEAAIGRNCFDFFATELCRKRRERFDEAIRTGAGLRFEDERDGINFDNILSPVLAADGKVAMVALFSRDITAMKKIEEEIKERNIFLNTILESLTHPFYVVDVLRHRVLIANAAARKTFATGDATCYSMTHGRDKPCNTSEHPCPLEIVKQTKAPLIVEHIHFDRDGTPRNVEIHAYPVLDQAGNVTSVIEYAVDITERRQAEEDRTRLTTAVEQSDDSIVMTDTTGKILYVNQAFERTSGYSREEAIGANPRILKSGNHDEEFYRHMWETVVAGKVWTGNIINKKKDGSLYEEKCSISPVKDFSGNIVNIVAVKRDVTQEVKLQKQLVQAQKMESIGTLAGGIAHDFNNLLTIMSGYAEIALLEMEEKDKGYGELSIVREAAARGADLVRQLLTLSRRVESSRRPTNLNHAVRRTEKLLTRTIPKMIAIELSLEDDLRTIDADPGQIEQIIMNLAINGRDAMPEGGRLVIETRNVFLDGEYCSSYVGVAPGEYVLLSVADTGYGMKKEVLERIFEPFFTTKRPGEGTGLGLSMVYGIVKAHGGHVGCYSEPGLGTTFRVYFPVMEVGALTDDRKVQAVQAGGTELVLLVDDEELIRALGERILTGAGYKVLTANNGKEALAVYRENKDDIALVILDLIMPEMGGSQCLEELLKISPELKVVVASGFSLDGRTGEIVDARARGFVQKPYKLSQMLSAVREVLDS